MKQICISLVLLLLVALPLSAQIDRSRLEINPFMRSFLNPNKLQISHSMGFEAGTSSMGSGYYLSRYTNHISYKFSPKLELDLDLNLVNFGSATTKSGVDFNDDNRTQVLPEFSLRYKPSDSFSLELHYQQNPFLHQRSMLSPWSYFPTR